MLRRMLLLRRMLVLWRMLELKRMVALRRMMVNLVKFADDGVAADPGQISVAEQRRLILQGDFFNWFRPKKFLVEDGKSLPKK